MSKKTETTKNKLQPLDIITFLLAAFYMQSVLTVAHHAAFRFPESVGRTVESPAVTFLIIGTLLVGYSYFKEKRFNTLSIISLTVFATSSLFWLSGLRANFFF